MNVSRVCLMFLLLLIGCDLVGFGQSEESTVGSQHGTCAIVLATKTDVAVAVDSKLTRFGTQPSCEQNNRPGCKAVLVRKDVLLVVTGLFNDSDGLNDWVVSQETEKLLTKLPKTVTMDAMSQFSEEWFTVLNWHYRGMKPPHPNNTVISTLLVISRINGVPYIYRFDVHAGPAGLLEGLGEFLFVADKPGLMYAGSCRDNIGKYTDEVYLPPFDPPGENFQRELTELGSRKNHLTTASEFATVLREYEDIFQRIEDSKRRCVIGPPIDVATWGKGEDGWTTDFKVSCRPKP